MADVTEYVHGPFHLPKRPRRLADKIAQSHTMLSDVGHLTRCCQFDDGTRQLAEITYKDALENGSGNRFLSRVRSAAKRECEP